MWTENQKAGKVVRFQHVMRIAEVFQSLATFETQEDVRSVVSMPIGKGGYSA